METQKRLKDLSDALDSAFLYCAFIAGIRH